jgi:hypothetical protein
MSNETKYPTPTEMTVGKRAWRQVMPDGSLRRYYAEHDPIMGVWRMREQALRSAPGTPLGHRVYLLAWRSDGPFCGTPEQVEAVLEAMGAETGWTEEG